MDNNTEMIKETNKKLIVPFIAISLVMLLLITGGVTYAYFTGWASTGNTAVGTVSPLPNTCARGCTVASQQCNLVVTYPQMSVANNTKNYTATCYINVGVRGVAGQDKVTYGVNFYGGSYSAASVSGYTWDNLEASYQAVAPAGTETNLWSVNTTGVALRASHDLTVAGTAGACNSSYTYENTAVTIKFRNLNKNQTPLIPSNQNTVWQYYLTTTSFNCTVN